MDWLEGYVRREDNIEIFYKYLNKSAPCLVFLHGGGGSSSSWYQVESALIKENYSLLFIDLRGHGKSSRGKGNWFGLDKFASDVDAVLDALKISKGIVVAICFGSVVAQVFAANYSHRIQGLVLINSSLKPFPNFIYRQFVLIFTKLILMTTFKGFRDHIDYSGHFGRNDISLRCFYDDLRSSGSSTVARTYELTANFKSPLKPTNNYPVLIKHGKRDTIINWKTGRDLLDVYPHADYILMDSNHISVINSAPIVIAELLKFLTKNFT